MNIYTGLLFQQGFIQDAGLALSLSEIVPAATHDQTLVSRSERAQTVAAVAQRKPSRFGAIVDVCSVVLSPFR